MDKKKLLFPCWVSNARFIRHQTGFTNPMDDAIVQAYSAMFSDHEQIMDMYTKVEEFPFDFVKRRMSIIVREEIPDVIDGMEKGVAPVFLICKVFIFLSWLPPPLL